MIAFFLISFFSNGQPLFQLAPPMLKYPSIFLSSSPPLALEMIFNQPGAAIHYSMDGREPTMNDPVYVSPLAISKRTTVKARTMGTGFSPSETVGVEFISPGKIIKKITYSPPHASYADSKTDILNDDMGGFTNYRKNWLGYDRDTVEIDIVLDRKEKIRSVLLDLLQDENGWIFLPEQIVLYYYDESGAWIEMANESQPATGPSPKQTILKEIKTARPVKADRLKLVMRSVKKIPDWHAGKGSHAWLFIDEIKVY